MTRMSQNTLGRAVIANNGEWDGDVTLTGECITELTFLATHLPSQNGQFIPINKTANLTLEHAEIKNTIAQVQLSENDLENLIVSDASETHAYIFSTSTKYELIEDHKFEDYEKSLSSSQREMRAALIILHRRGLDLKKL